MSARHPVRTAALVLAAVAVLSGAVAPQRADAHARVLRTSPAQGAELSGPPARVGLLFDEAVRPTGSASASGGSLPRPVRAPEHLERNGRLLVVPLPAKLRRGVYTVHWTVVSDDGHREVGAVTFGID